MKSWAIQFFSIVAVASAGCSDIDDRPAVIPFSNSSVVQLDATELQQRIGSCERHLLVQFGGTDCVHCESMKRKLDHLASIYFDDFELVKVDYERNVDIVKNYGGTVCPTYVLFERGQKAPAFVGPFPISRDDLEAELLSVLALSDDW